MNGVNYQQNSYLTVIGVHEMHLCVCVCVCVFGILSLGAVAIRDIVVNVLSLVNDKEKVPG